MLGTRPDIAYTVIKMLQFSSNPIEEHLQKALYIVCYLSSFQDPCIMYVFWTWWSEWFVYILWHGLGWRCWNISLHHWLSRWQWWVTLFSTKAEYCGITEVAKQFRWIHNVYEELQFKIGPLPLCINNQGAIFLALNPAQEGHTKHVCMTDHYIRESVEFGEIKLYYVLMD